MAKSVLGDDPFAAGDRTPGDQGRAAKKARAKKKTAKKAPTKKKSAAKKAPAKKAPAKKAPAKKTAKKARAGKPATPANSDRPTGGAAPASPPVAPTLRKPAGPGAVPLVIDGAAARRAARATATLGEAPPEATPAPLSGHGIDPEAGRRPVHSGSLVDELRRIEHHVTRRPRDAMQPAVRGPSLLDRVGQMMRPDTYRAWLSGWKMRTRSDVVDDFGLDPVYAERWGKLLEFLYHSYFRVEAVGMDNLPDHGRALIVSNHSGTLPLDGAMIMYAVRFCHPAHRDVRPLVEDFVFHFPFLGMTMNRIGCVRACQENAERLLEGDQVVAVFPEGIKGIGKRYRERYQLQRFGRGGFVKLALKSGAPIIPAAVIGAEEAYPMLTKVTWLAKYLGIPYIPITPTFPWLGPAGALPLPSKWTIRFGEPMDLVGKHGTDAHNDRILVNRLTEQVRSTIQTMVDDTLSSRRSIIFG